MVLMPVPLSRPDIEEEDNFRTVGHGSPGRDHFCKPSTTFSASWEVKGTKITSEAGFLFCTSSPSAANTRAGESGGDCTTASTAAGLLLDDASASLFLGSPPLKMNPRRARARAR